MKGQKKQPTFAAKKWFMRKNLRESAPLQISLEEHPIIPILPHQQVDLMWQASGFMAIVGILWGHCAITLRSCSWA